MPVWNVICVVKYACVKKNVRPRGVCLQNLVEKGYVMSEAMQANEAQTSDHCTPFPIPWRITQVRSCCQVKKISNQLFIASSFSDTLQIFPALKHLKSSDILIRLDLHTSSFFLPDPSLRPPRLLIVPLRPSRVHFTRGSVVTKNQRENMRTRKRKLHSNDVFSTNEMSVLIFGRFFQKLAASVK